MAAASLPENNREMRSVSALALTVASTSVWAQHMNMPGMTMPMKAKPTSKKAAPKKAAPKDERREREGVSEEACRHRSNDRTGADGRHDDAHGA